LATVPNRARFSRGFLWDEGFSLLVICKWDISLCCEILDSWLNTMDASGWIPSEQARGKETTSNIPNEFLAISDQNDVPPVFLMALQILLKSSHEKAINLLGRRFSDWVKWFSHYEKRFKNDAQMCTFSYRGRTSILTA